MIASQRPRILLLIPHLGGGGAERVTALLARGLSPEKYEVHLGVVTQAQSGGEPLPLPVQLHRLGASRVRAGAIPLLRLVRRLRPELILSGMYHLNFLVVMLRPLFPRGTCVLIRQNATISSSLAMDGLPGYTRLLYRRADRVICQTRAMADDLARELGLAENRLAVLPNPVDVEEIRAFVEGNPARQREAGPQLVAVGRLSREKGFDLLLRALALLRAEFPGVSLLIAGAGAEEAALKAECRALGIADAVRFAGYEERPVECYSGATLFVLPSRHEGLPNALLEAAVAGLPIVALPASEGLVELLHGQAGVWLAPEISSEALAVTLAAALRALQPGERFVHEFVEQFRIERAIAAYETQFDQSLAGKP